MLHGLSHLIWIWEKYTFTTLGMFNIPMNIVQVQSTIMIVFCFGKSSKMIWIYSKVCECERRSRYDWNRIWYSAGFKQVFNYLKSYKQQWNQHPNDAESGSISVCTYQYHECVCTNCSKQTGKIIWNIHTVPSCVIIEMSTINFISSGNIIQLKRPWKYIKIVQCSHVFLVKDIKKPAHHSWLW